jgi:pyruvate dehydrogenase E2 component (dihydrolipoamide acetyltransferase)
MEVEAVLELKLPELGENIEEAEVAAVLVKTGDRVERDQPVVEVETEKANLEVPAPSAGTVGEVKVRVGDRIKIGQTILTIEDTPPAEGVETEARPEPEPAETERPVVAEGAGSEEMPAGAPKTPSLPPSAPREIGRTVPAAPSVRALGRELGVDLFQVKGSGPGGRISRDDVKAHAKAIVQASKASTTLAAAPPKLPDFGQWGEVVRERLSSVRRATAAGMATAWAQVPHVTQFDHADVTQLDAMRRKFNQRPEVAERKLSMTAIVIKLVAAALKQFPKFNASLDPAAEEVILKNYIHIGVAVDTDRGLLVPVIRDVDDKNLLQIAAELIDLAGRARSRKLGLDEMKGACFTVSNLGGLGTTYFSPIVPWPQVAILGVGRAERQAAWGDDQFEPRLIMPLSISYDHRWIDGADAARFLRWLAEALEQPLLLLLDD